MKSIKLLSFILLALFATQAMSQTEVDIDGIKYGLNTPATGEATVLPTKQGNSSYSGDIFIPETVTLNCTPKVRHKTFGVFYVQTS